MSIINLTPHKINIYNEQRELVQSIPSSGVARCTVEKKLIMKIGLIDLYETIFGEVEGLPPFDGDVIIIVSMLARQASKRGDLVSPGELLRDDNGYPIGCIGLSW